VLGEPQGKVKNLIVVEKGAQRRVAGIKTFDGQDHFGELVIVAGECKPTSPFLADKI